jgi:hypothetical protein
MFAQFSAYRDKKVVGLCAHVFVPLHQSTLSIDHKTRFNQLSNDMQAIRTTAVAFVILHRASSRSHPEEWATLITLTKTRSILDRLSTYIP